ncbi:MAG: hypothetical protein Tsb002_21500 [Wenzhouxiangellaceae bacterium]
MPIYEYQPQGADSCEVCANGFELLERLSDEPLAHCLACKNPVRRVISAPRLNSSNADLNPDNLGKKGFTQYRRIGKGQYEKTAGKGPQFISDD